MSDNVCGCSVEFGDQFGEVNIYRLDQPGSCRGNTPSLFYVLLHADIALWNLFPSSEETPLLNKTVEALFKAGAPVGPWSLSYGDPGSPTADWSILSCHWWCSRS